MRSGCSNLTLKVSRDGASTTSQGNLFQCYTTFIGKNVFLISSLNLLSLSLKPLLIHMSLNLLYLFSPSFLPVFFFPLLFCSVFSTFFRSICPSSSSNSTKHVQVQLHSSSGHPVIAYTPCLYSSVPPMHL